MKHITLKLSIFSMILLSTILFSCKEEPPVRSGEGIRITNSSTLTIANPLNPYDNAGVLHNQGIEYLLNNRSYFGTNVDSMCLDIVNVIGDFFENENPLNVNNPETYYRDSISHLLFNKRAMSLTALYSSQGYSSYSINLNDSIFTVIGDLANNTTNLAYFIAEVKVIEHLLLNDNNLNSSEKEWLLSQTSILRYSTALWKDVIENLSGGDTNKDYDEVPLGMFSWLGKVWDYCKENPWKCIFIGLSDAAGAASGGGVWGAVASSSLVFVMLESN